MSRVVADLTFHEEWFCEKSQETLARLFGLVAVDTGQVVEVGSWEGRSTVALAAAAAPVQVRAVDTWRGSPGEPSAELAGERDVYATFAANTAHLDNLSAFRMGWREYVSAGLIGPTRFLFIDAEHSYREVHDTIQAWRPHMLPGSIMCGDDNHYPPVQQAVLDAFGDANLEATLWWVQL